MICSSSRTTRLFALCVLGVCCVVLTVPSGCAAKKPKKTYVLVGMTGSGKSTLGNCLFNRDGALDKIERTPFNTSNTADGCTTAFVTASNDAVQLLDTVGFGDACQRDERTASAFDAALASVDSQVDAVLFVVRAGRFNRATVDFFRWIQTSVFEQRCVNNSVLIVTDAHKGWVAQNRANTHVAEALANCNQRYVEFALRMTHPSDTDEDLWANVAKRERSIDDLVAYLASQRFERINLRMRHTLTLAEVKVIFDAFRLVVAASANVVAVLYEYARAYPHIAECYRTADLFELNRIFNAIREANKRLGELKLSEPLIGIIIGVSLGAGISGVQAEASSVMLLVRDVLIEMDPLNKLKVSLGMACGALAGWLFAINDGFDSIDELQQWTLRKSGGFADLFAILFA